MSLAIDVQELTKRYDISTAVDRISFTVNAGEIMGCLGPNGAGKTTTIRILTGMLSPTSGSVKINGMDIETQSLAIRRAIGYLPENVALYPELRVEEYLTYRACIKGVPRPARKNRVTDAIMQCALGDVRRKLIGRLSKGFRQRVGLADALVGHPSILILDEPTVGLDPHQIRQTRELIQQLGQRSTILLSTHILPEVEMICQRVTIIDKGRIVAIDTPENLRRRLAGNQVIRVEVRAEDPDIEQALSQVSGVSRVVRQAGTNFAAGPDGVALFEVEANANPDVREAIFRLAVQRNWVLRQLSSAQASLEDVFIHLTTHEADT